MNDFQRRYVSEVRRCSEMERKLRYVRGELPEPPPPPKPSPTLLSPREINILEVRNPILIHTIVLIKVTMSYERATAKTVQGSTNAKYTFAL